MMKFMETIFTQEGAGVVVARGVDGGVLVEMNPREVEVEGKDGKPVKRDYPGRCVMMQHCQAHGVWFERECELCKEVRQ